MSGTSVMGSLRKAVDPTGMVWKDPKPPEPSPPPPPPDVTDAAVQGAAAKQRTRARSLLSLNPTGGGGVTGTAPVTSRTLLGQA